MGRRAIYKRNFANRYDYYSWDSLLDLCMLEKANHAFAPLHGELGAMHDNLQPHILKQTQSAYMPQKKS